MIAISKEIKERLGMKEDEEVEISLEGDQIIIRRLEDPFKVLEDLLGDLTFSRDLRRVAEEEALKEVNG